METLELSADVAVAVPTLADVIAAYTRADNSLLTVREAILADMAAFSESAILTFAAIAAGVTASDIARAAKVAGVGYKSVATVLRHSRTGEILSLGGDMEEGFNPRDIQVCYDKTTKLNGVRVTISVTPKQHSAIVTKATDVMDAYRMLVKANRENLAALTAVAAAESEKSDEESDEESESDGGRVLSVTENLAAALAALTAVRDGLTDDDIAATVDGINEIQQVLNDIADMVDAA